jgi:hypothetical protein
MPVSSSKGSIRGSQGRVAAGVAECLGNGADFEHAPNANAAKIHAAQMISNLMITNGTTGILLGTRHRWSRIPAWKKNPHCRTMH